MGALEELSESKPELFAFELVSPERRLASLEAWQVCVPSVQGEMGVRSGHMALAVLVHAGVVKIWESPDSDPHLVFITGGFVDITPHACVVLAEDADMIDDLDFEQITQNLKSLRARLEDTNDGPTRMGLRRQISIEEAKRVALSTYFASS